MALTIRPARPSDATVIHRIAQATLPAVYDDLLGSATVADRLAADYDPNLLRESVLAPGPFPLAIDDDPVGFAQLGPARAGTPTPVAGEGVAVIYRLYVLPTRWREAIGSRLLTAGERRLDNDVETLRAVVYADNARARSFFDAQEFSVVDRLDATPPEVIYERDRRA